MKFFWFVFALTAAIEVLMTVLSISVLRQDSKIGIVLIAVLFLLTILIHPLAIYSIGRPLDIGRLEFIIDVKKASIFALVFLLSRFYDYLIKIWGKV